MHTPVKPRDFLRGAGVALGSSASLPQSGAELKKLDLEVVIPVHCSGANFIDAMWQQMPEKLVLSTVGSRFTFGV